ncbi:sugar phosphate isomerase/epimerase family protein [Arcticibacterium luteifluviistationis]|uniref:Xylose isomerase n=1 Tax=Arcticibacterium luteifluviistationis TaxID=1784714 RepID=A0A2Z4GDP1_9BACT|nr:sugar phosphate isomerase/epimerase family protein [Arcticibacterium luteifluviistationis]AWV99429.1 xylose isomerase [Arcticibacterium luteifluviistationis]
MNLNRRLFLATVLSGFVQMSFKKGRKLCFSTLGCPDWTWEEIINNAEKYGYKGIEIRGIGAEIDILKSPVFSKAMLKESKRRAEDSGIEIVNINPSSKLHETDVQKRKANIDEVKNYVDLAVELDCPFVRVFPDKFAFKNDKQKSLNLISEGLQEVNEYANGSGVKVLLDCHGDLVLSNDIKQVMNEQPANSSGIIWDYFNMHYQTEESAATMVKALKPYIEFVQIKDGSFTNRTTHEYFLPGQGQVPIDKVLKELDKIKYKGFISLEWEKRWHPELPNLEKALPVFSKVVNA